MNTRVPRQFRQTHGHLPRAVNEVMLDRRLLSRSVVEHIVRWLREHLNEPADSLWDYNVLGHIKDVTSATSWPATRDAANKSLDFLDNVMSSDEFAGQTTDYTKMHAGERCPDSPRFVLSRCPACGCVGNVYGEPGFARVTHHVIRVLSGMASEVLDSCKW